MALTQVTIDWDASNYINRVKIALNGVVKEGAEKTAEDAKLNLERTAKRKATQILVREIGTGTLASQIEVKASKFKDGGYIVEAQGSGNYNITTTKKGTIRRRYYASFVELGTRKMEGQGYLRKALRRNRYRMRKLLERELNAIVR